MAQREKAVDIIAPPTQRPSRRGRPAPRTGVQCLGPGLWLCLRRALLGITPAPTASKLPPQIDRGHLDAVLPLCVHRQPDVRAVHRGLRTAVRRHSPRPPSIRERVLSARRGRSIVRPKFHCQLELAVGQLWNFALGRGRLCAILPVQAIEHYWRGVRRGVIAMD